MISAREAVFSLKVLGFDDDNGSARIELFFEGVGNLCGEAFLHLGPARVAVDEAR
jgi:hypothetical protein